MDLTATTFLDSSGSRALAVAARQEGPVLELVCPPGNREVRRVLDFVGLLELLPVHEQLPG